MKAHGGVTMCVVSPSEHHMRAKAWGCTLERQYAAVKYPRNDRISLLHLIVLTPGVEMPVCDVGPFIRECKLHAHYNSWCELTLKRTP